MTQNVQRNLLRCARKMSRHGHALPAPLTWENLLAAASDLGDPNRRFRSKWATGIPRELLRFWFDLPAEGRVMVYLFCVHLDAMT